MADQALLLIHGAANGAWVWDAWRRHLGPLGWQVNVLDLRGHGRSLPIDFDSVTMEDYLSDVESVVPQMLASQGAHPVIGGWSMGGLVAMMYAAKHQETPALVLLAPSPPREVAGAASPDEVRKTPATAFGPELYGLYPDDLDKSRRPLADLDDGEARQVLANCVGAQESGLARRQRKRGIRVPPGSIRCPVLVVYGEKDTAISPSHSRQVALYLAGESIAVPDAGHWGIVCSDHTVSDLAPTLDAWLRRKVVDGR